MKNQNNTAYGNQQQQRGIKAQGRLREMAPNGIKKSTSPISQIKKSPTKVQLRSSPRKPTKMTLTAQKKEQRQRK